MAKLLKSETFDSFELHKFTIKSDLATFEAARPGDEQPVPSWNKMRPMAFEVVKNSGAPKSMKVVLGLKHDEDEFMQFLNINFDDGRTTITSGVSHKSFTMDKSAQFRWNDYIIDFLNNNNITFTNDLS